MHAIIKCILVENINIQMIINAVMAISSYNQISVKISAFMPLRICTNSTIVQ